MANPQYRLDEEEKKIIDLIRQHKLDYEDVKILFERGAGEMIDIFKRMNLSEQQLKNLPSAQRDHDKYTKLLEYLEKGE